MVLSSLIENNKKAFFVYEFWETVLQKKKKVPFLHRFHPWQIILHQPTHKAGNPISNAERRFQFFVVSSSIKVWDPNAIGANKLIKKSCLDAPQPRPHCGQERGGGSRNWRQLDCHPLPLSTLREKIKGTFKMGHLMVQILNWCTICDFSSHQKLSISFVPCSYRYFFAHCLSGLIKSLVGHIGHTPHYVIAPKERGCCWVVVWDEIRKLKSKENEKLSAYRFLCWLLYLPKVATTRSLLGQGGKLKSAETLGMGRVSKQPARVNCSRFFFSPTGGEMNDSSSNTIRGWPENIPPYLQLNYS